MTTEFREDANTKSLTSETFNFHFNKKTGLMVSWGKTPKDDPEYSPYGPTILDMEVTTICGGPDAKHPCPFCYKSNSLNGKNMSFETFKEIFDGLPKTVTQIAFGADATLSSNPDLWRMMSYARTHGVIPNITAANISKETATLLKQFCGAVAISRYHNPDWCYDSVQNLTSLGMTQVNIHCLLSQETYRQALDTLDDIQNDPRLSKLNAIVFLSLKTKGRGEHFHTLNQTQFDTIVEKALKNHVSFGFDSCSSLKFFDWASRNNCLTHFKDMIEPCEATLFSGYINTEGKYSPCSFTEGQGDWADGGIPVRNSDFIKDVWDSDRTKAFRRTLLESKCKNRFSCRTCPLFNI